MHGWASMHLSRRCDTLCRGNLLCMGLIRFSLRPPLKAIAAGLEERGIPAARGGKWSAVQVARLLEAVAGPFRGIPYDRSCGAWVVSSVRLLLCLRRTPGASCCNVSGLTLGSISLGTRCFSARTPPPPLPACKSARRPSSACGKFIEGLFASENRTRPQRANA
jgi:hypothetical protein